MFDGFDCYGTGCCTADSLIVRWRLSSNFIWPRGPMTWRRQAYPLQTPDVPRVWSLAPWKNTRKKAGRRGGFRSFMIFVQTFSMASV